MGGGPNEWLGFGVVLGEVVADRRLQLVHAAEDPTANAVLGDVAKETLIMSPITVPSRVFSAASSSRIRERATIRAGSVLLLAQDSNCLRSSGVNGKASAFGMTSSSIREAGMALTGPLKR